MADIFDIGLVTEHFSVTNLKFYLDRLKAARTSELTEFRRAVLSHQKSNRTHQAFQNTPLLTTHGAVIAAIDHELRQRSWKKWPYRIWLPVRRMSLQLAWGLELKEHPAFGHIAVKPEGRQHLLHVPASKAMCGMLQFCQEHWKILLPSAIALLGIIVGLVK